MGKVKTMAYLEQGGAELDYHLRALFTTEVISQQANRPCGNLMEGRPKYSAKHKQHGCKTEASVVPTEICTNLSPHAKGGQENIFIF